MNLHGFNIIEQKNIDGADFTIMRHEKTGARLAWFNDMDENKLFSISFRTVPEDNTGVFHILEHSVLGGSQKYPVKEPFLYMLKSSMNTFLNAMTFPDKTMFPVSSRNTRDFMNLTEVYLDAVFKPSIYTNPCIFQQEGHHIEYNGDPDKALYKGVVFNEMKGVQSSVHERIESEIMSMLFPESCYRFEYGGLPAEIPELTEQQFIDTHKRFYHPSNSYIYLDGNIDIEPVLQLIDSYLSEYEQAEGFPEIAVQSTVKPVKSVSYYEAPAGADEENGAYIAIGKVLTSWEDIEKNFAYSVMCEALAGSNDSPLKRAVLDTGLCLDMELSLTDGTAQPFGVLRINNINYEDSKQMLAEVRRIVQDIVDNGIGREVLLSAINRCEFNFIESEEPRGLIRNISAMSSWLYGGEPDLYIGCAGVFDSLREKVNSGYFEKLLAEWLIEEDGRAVLYMLPSASYGDEEKQQEQERINATLSAMSDSEKTALVQLNEKLMKWQTEPDSAEDIAKLPTLELSEVSDKPVNYLTEELSECGIKILNHPAKTKGITCLNLWFDISDMNRRQLEMLVLVDSFISELPTSESTGAELAQKITGILGSFSTDISAFSKPETPDRCRVYFSVKSRFLTKNTAQALALISEILTLTNYDNPETIGRIIKQDVEELRQDIIADGHRFAMRRARAEMSAESAVNELVNGYEVYSFLRELTDKDIPELIPELSALSRRVFSRARLTAGIASAENISIKTLADSLPEGENTDGAELFKSSLGMEFHKAQRIVIPSGVSYTGAVLSARTENRALWDVLSTILTYEYLWNEVRVKGGAYGTGAGTNILGEIVFYSFRDPSPSQSLDIYANTADFLENFCNTNPDISSAIISTIAKGEPLISDGAYCTTADIFNFRGVDYEERREVRRKILALRTDDLYSALPELRTELNYCIIGADSGTEDDIFKSEL